VLFFPILILPQSRDSLKNYQLHDVVITATRTENSLMNLGNSISLIDSAEINKRNKLTVFDLLKEEYGISFNSQGGANKLASIYTRGANPNHTLVLVDGVELNLTNDPGNTYDFSALPTDNVARIEVLRGPQSTLYGSNAMAGVINIITQKGSGAPRFSLSSEGGSYGTYKGMANLSGSYDIFNYSVAVSRFKTNGFSSASANYGNTEKDGSDNYNLTSRFGLNLLQNSGVVDNLNFNLFYRFTKGNSDYDQWGGLHGDDPTFVFHLQEAALRGEANAALFNGLWNSTLGASFFRNVRNYSYDSTTFNPYSSTSFYDGSKVKFDWQNNFKLTEWNLFTFGIESENEEANSVYYSNSSLYGSYASLFPSNRSFTTGLFIQDQIKVGNLFAAIGVRTDKHNMFGSVTTYRIAPAYFIPETGTKFKFTFGTAFHSPSLFDLFDPAYGNSALRPEKNTGWDLGVEQYLNNNKVSVGITYFSNRFENLFGYNSNFRTINIDKAETHGVELYSTTVITTGIKFKLNYTFLKSNELQGPDKGLPLLRRPAGKLGFVLFNTFGNKLNTTFELDYVSERFDNDFSSFTPVRVKLKPYTLVNVSASYTLFSFLDIYGRVDNLFNTAYEEIYGYGVPALSGYLGFKLIL
jgi:vitamin B12 transporter